eukprot:35412-Eustigmatos_ZCMA.PRE.1
MSSQSDYPGWAQTICDEQRIRILKWHPGGRSSSKERVQKQMLKTPRYEKYTVQTGDVCSNSSHRMILDNAKSSVTP